jgi:MFS transporter, FHS family, glucose/mannose:H+ symporter
LALSTTNDQEARPDRIFSVGTNWISSFLLAGVLLGSTGPLLVAWQYHLGTDPRLIGLHFLAMSAGYLAAAILSRCILLRFPVQLAAGGASLIGCLAYVALSLLPPPVPALWRILTLGFAGFSGGVLVSALLYGLRSRFTEAPSEVTARAGAFFGLGCLLATLTVSTTYFAGSIQIQTLLLAVVPLCYMVFYLRTQGQEPVTEEVDDAAFGSITNLRSLAPVLFSLLLFFQFGNEWSIAGWLPLFLIHHLGVNPAGALFTLALYFATLILGRFLALWLMRRLGSRKLLLGSIAVAITGCLGLGLTNSLTEAVIAVIAIGLGFAPVYPLVAQNLDDRFSFHPAFYNSIFSVGITGALCAPWLLGYVNAYLPVEYVVLIPAIGSLLVLILAFLLLLDARLVASRPHSG